MITALLCAVLALGQEAADTEQAPAPEAPFAATQVTASLVLKVGKPVESADEIVDHATELGGWFQSRTQDFVSLRVPVEKTEDLLAFAEELGKVADRSAERTDVTHALVEARGKLESRQELLGKYYEVLKTADPKSIVGVERQIVQAIQQIEQLQGRIRVLEDRSTYARVDIAFRFRDRQAPRRDGSSSFRWLNTLNVADVMHGLMDPWPDWTSRAATPVTPAGFSAWRKTRRFRAASPDGVLYRVRSEKHKPRADLDFWKEAVRERMVAAGYTVVAETDAAGGARIELVSPLGQEDWTYLIQFFDDGNRLVIAEAAGEVSHFEEHRDAIVAAMEKANL